ncbi:MAG: cytochrome-c peroxidase [Acidithiobacillus sp.]
MRWSAWFQSVAIGSLPFLSGPLQAATLNGADQSLFQQARQLFQPLPANMATSAYPLTPALVALGRDLFFDPRISLDGTVSCAKCHQAALYGTDGLAKSIGVKDRLNPRNAPTVLNAALQIAEHWRGDRKDVEDQATQALVGPPSYGNPDYPAAMAKVEAIPGYSPLFQQAFPGEENPVTPQNWGRAIGAYERTLVTPSPFDAYLQGDSGALSLTARNGLRDFIAVGCASCHNGVGVGGGMFAKFGITEPYWKATGSKEIDKGRIDVSKNPADLYVFKVPSLRNVAMTAPYFHDGSVATLPAAVQVMAKVQLGRELTGQQVKDIVGFLDSLTGPLPKDFAEAPILPPAAFPGARQSGLSLD